MVAIERVRARPKRKYWTAIHIIHAVSLCVITSNMMRLRRISPGGDVQYSSKEVIRVILQVAFHAVMTSLDDYIAYRYNCKGIYMSVWP